MAIQITCTYCGVSWVEKKTDLNTIKCLKCKDSHNLTAKELHKSKIDYYAGSPAFPNYNKSIEQRFTELYEQLTETY